MSSKAQGRPPWLVRPTFQTGSRVVLALGVLLSVLIVVKALVARSPVVAQDEGSDVRPYRILVTNDDGIDAAGLAAVVKELSQVGEVTVSAPSENRSGSSHSVDLSGRQGLVVREQWIEGATLARAVDGTPADAVNFGLLALAGARPFDLVVSGINRGSNVGNVAHYSGTVGAAMEALYQGVSALAVSQDAASGDYSRAARFTAQVVRQLKARGAPPGVVLSINVPAVATRRAVPVVVAPMGDSYFRVSGYRRTASTGSDEIWQAILERQDRPLAGSDTKAYLEGHITVTPLRFDWTDETVLEELRDWELEVESVAR